MKNRIQKDWDDRVETDYRCWMADGTESDDAMWQTGKRDIDILFSGLTPTGRALEIGCGVGRLLYWSREMFESVVGVDVSEVALERAKEFFETDARDQ